MEILQTGGARIAEDAAEIAVAPDPRELIVLYAATLDQPPRQALRGYEASGRLPSVVHLLCGMRDATRKVYCKGE